MILASVCWPGDTLYICSQSPSLWYADKNQTFCVTNNYSGGDVWFAVTVADVLLSLLPSCTGSAQDIIHREHAEKGAAIGTDLRGQTSEDTASWNPGKHNVNHIQGTVALMIYQS